MRKHRNENAPVITFFLIGSKYDFFNAIAMFGQIRKRQWALIVYSYIFWKLHVWLPAKRRRP
jgi:hypothetical protein